MNKKVLGASIRRGVLTGTIAGFAAGWLAFGAHSKQFEVAEAIAADEVRSKRAELLLPAVPGLPTLPDVVQPLSYAIATGFARPLPRIQLPARPGAVVPITPASTPRTGAAPSVAPFSPPQAAAPLTPAPLPVVTFAPLPPPPPAPKPVPTTAPSPK